MLTSAPSTAIRSAASAMPPVLPDFLVCYPPIRSEWHFENRAVGIIAESYDRAIGGGFELSPGVVARTLAPAHIVAVASPAYMVRHLLPTEPAALDGIFMRSLQSGRIRHWTMRDSTGAEIAATLSEYIVVNDPPAIPDVDAGILVERTGYRRNRVFAAEAVLAIVNRSFGSVPID